MKDPIGGEVKHRNYCSFIMLNLLSFSINKTWTLRLLSFPTLPKARLIPISTLQSLLLQSEFNGLHT